MGLWTRPDLSDFQQLEAEPFDLHDNAEQSGPIFKPTGEHGLAADQLIRHRGKSRQGGGSELTLDPDRVYARPCGHAAILPGDRVSRLGRNPVIGPRSELFRRCPQSGSYDRGVEQAHEKPEDGYEEHRPMIPFALAFLCEAAS